MILSGYEQKTVRITTLNGSVFEGVAETFPPLHGLHEYGREEESLAIGETQIFLSEIRTLEILEGEDTGTADPGRFDILIGRLLEEPYLVADILPQQVGADAAGQYFAIERYYLESGRIRELRRKFAGILLRLNCYFNMAVSFDGCESWEENPDPESFADHLTSMAESEFLLAVFPEQRAMIEIEPDDTYMTIYDPDVCLADILMPLVRAEGLFAWNPETHQEEGT